MLGQMLREAPRPQVQGPQHKRQLPRYLGIHTHALTNASPTSQFDDFNVSCPPPNPIQTS